MVIRVIDPTHVVQEHRQHPLPRLPVTQVTKSPIRLPHHPPPLQTILERVHRRYRTNKIRQINRRERRPFMGQDDGRGGIGVDLCQ